MTEKSYVCDMSPQSFFSLFVYSVSLSNLDQTVSHQEFIVTGREDGSRDVDQNCDPGVVIV